MEPHIMRDDNFGYTPLQPGTFREIVDVPSPKLPRLVASAAEKYGHEVEASPSPIIKTSKEFVTGFVPPEYVVVGLLQRRFIYSNTGQTGAGKTAVALRLAASAALGILFAGRVTK